MPHTLIRAAGASFLIIGFLGRLPAACNQLGMLLIVADSGLGLAAAGTTVASVGVGTAIGAPLIGRAVDRFGPIRVVTTAMALQTLALAGVITVLHTGAPLWILFAVAALLGAANPQAGSIARACWSSIARTHKDSATSLRTLRQGFGFETAADETSFVVGPIVAGLFVTTMGAQGAAAALLACTLVFETAFVLWLATHRTIHHGRSGTAETPHASINYRSLLPFLGTVFATGMVFGATQTALTAINQAAGHESLTGSMYGALGVTSALAGLVTPSMPWAWTRKLVLGGAVVAVCSALIATVPGPVAIVGLILVMGAGVGNNLSTAYTELEKKAPAGRITTVMTTGATCLILGVSGGSIVAGFMGESLHTVNVAAIVAGGLIMAIGLGAYVRK